MPTGSIDRCGAAHPTIPGLVCARLAHHHPTWEHGGRRPGETSGTTWSSRTSPWKQGLVKGLVIDDPWPADKPIPALPTPAPGHLLILSRVHPDDTRAPRLHADDLATRLTADEKQNRAQRRSRTAPGPKGANHCRGYVLVEEDPYDHLFRLAHTPGATLLGIQRAAVKDAIRSWWKARPDTKVSLRVRLPGVTLDDCDTIAAAMLRELRADDGTVHRNPVTVGNVIEITPNAGRA